MEPCCHAVQSLNASGPYVMYAGTPSAHIKAPVTGPAAGAMTKR